jgi:hypothetical protein
MGILIQGNFQSPDGFTYSSFYLKITAINLTINSKNVNVRVSVSNYLSRELSKSGSSSLFIKSIFPSYAFNIPIDKIDSISILSYMYYLISTVILIPQSTVLKIQVEPVLEESQTVFVPSGDLVSIQQSSIVQVSDSLRKIVFNK